MNFRSMPIQTGVAIFGQEIFPFLFSKTRLLKVVWAIGFLARLNVTFTLLLTRGNSVMSPEYDLQEVIREPRVALGLSVNSLAIT